MKMIKLTRRTIDGSKRYLYVNADCIEYIIDSEIHFKDGNSLFPVKETSEQIVKMLED